MEIRSEYIKLKVSDGTDVRGWTARPAAAGAHPGLIVFQEAFGVNAHIRDITERFAREVMWPFRRSLPSDSRGL
jgi:carboxymethylenebutenolidase